MMSIPKKIIVLSKIDGLWVGSEAMGFSTVAVIRAVETQENVVTHQNRVLGWI